MKILLDTHALLWWMAGDERLPVSARALIADEVNTVYVNAALAWEIATKHRRGKLPGAGPLVVDFAAEIQQQSFELLVISLEHAMVAGNMRSDHRDSFDRMLIAQARVEHMALVSNETLFDTFDIVRVW